MRKIDKYIPLMTAITATACAFAHTSPWVIAIFAISGGIWSLWDTEDHENTGKKE